MLRHFPGLTRWPALNSHLPFNVQEFWGKTKQLNPCAACLSQRMEMSNLLPSRGPACLCAWPGRCGDSTDVGAALPQARQAAEAALFMYRTPSTSASRVTCVPSLLTPGLASGAACSCCYLSPYQPRGQSVYRQTETVLKGITDSL